MSLEQKNDLINWWNEQSFAGKELFILDENGALSLRTTGTVKERVVANLSAENADFLLRNLQEKFTAAELKFKELEAEWAATDDKLKLADKVGHQKEYLQHVNAVGDFSKIITAVTTWEKVVNELMEVNHAAKLKLAELAESVADSVNWKDANQTLRDVADKWKLAGHVDKFRNDKLWNRIEVARKTFHERKRLHHEEEEKDLLVNLDLKIDLVEQAESIANSTDWKNTTEVFHRLTEEWKTIGHTLNKKNEELWQRFLAAKSTFFERKREHYGKVQAEQETNYAVKLTIVEKAEALRASTEWNATSLAYAGLMEEWKKTGRVPHEKADELWKRFTEAQEQFFEAKRRHFDEIKSVQENNYLLKKAIYEQAENLKNSNYWSETTAVMNELLDEWKKIGPIPRSYGDKMWEDFNAARKYFFNRKDASRELRKIQAEQQVLARKQQVEAQVALRKLQAKEMVIQLANDIKEEEEKLADFKVAINNIQPGKKAAQLKSHLEQLIIEGERHLKRLTEKFAQAKDDLKVPEQEPANETEAETTEAQTEAEPAMERNNEMN